MKILFFCGIIFHTDKPKLNLNKGTEIFMNITNEIKKELIASATKSRENSYSPYSKFKVGSAVLGEDGVIYSGCNIESVSYGLTVCGERTAIFNMVSKGCKKFVALAVIAAENPEGSAPCGACRQVIAEFSKDLKTTPILVAGTNGEFLEYSAGELLPLAFTNFVPNE